jgi:protease-4
MKSIIFSLLIALLVFALPAPAGAHPVDLPGLTPTAGPEKKDRDADKPKKDDDEEDEEEAAESSDSSAGRQPAAKEEKKADSAADKDKAAKKPDPIRKLIEVRLDTFLVPARAINLPLPGRTRTLRETLERFEKWSKDDEVGAVLLNLDGLALAMPDVEELRAGVADLRRAGKKVVAFLSSGDDMSYLLACGADEIAMAPSAGVAIPGMGRLFPFMRGLYQLQGIEFDVIAAGRFKYPGFLTAREPNQYFLEEFNEILDGWYGDYVQFIADGRRLSVENVRSAIDLCLMDAREARSRGLVDVVAYYDDYVDRVVRRTKFKKTPESESDFSRITSFNDVLNAWSREVKKSLEGYKAVGPKIAVLHARGPIVDMNLGAGFSSSLIMRDEFVKTIEEIRKNKTVQAVVLRIDSPGGSGYASDVIWHKLRELDEEKPLVVSMGTVAGSGGYYIACPGRLIFAEPTTITGSIGVLAILANQASALNRMDVNLAEMKRGRRALLGAGHRDMIPADRDLIQKYILDFYEIFLDRVSTTRKMPKDEVRKIAEGRIYTGRQALKVGLVDRLGCLKDAIAAAREFANIPPSAEIKLVHYPRPSSIGELLFDGLSGVSVMEVAVGLAQQPAPAVGFQDQVRLLTQRVQPLCWMAVPEACCLLRPFRPADDIADWLAPPRPLPLPQP